MVDNANKIVKNYIFNSYDTLGRGQFWTVYLAKNIHNKKHYALKALPVRELKNNAKFYEIISNEFETLKYLQDVQTPHIVHLIEFFTSQKYFYVITEYCNGGDLQKVLSEKGALPEAQVLEYLRQFIDGYKELHKKKIMHRDLTLANLMIHDGILKISDFGFSKILEKCYLPLRHSIKGTPLTMSPQIFKGQMYSEKCDIWSLGIILFELLYDKLPWTASEGIGQYFQEIYNRQLVFPEVPGKKVSAELKQFIFKCLRQDEKDRISWGEIFSHPFSGIVPVPPVLNEKRSSSAHKLKCLAMFLSEEEKNGEIKPAPVSISSPTQHPPPMPQPTFNKTHSENPQVFSPRNNSNSLNPHSHAQSSGLTQSQNLGHHMTNSGASPPQINTNLPAPHHTTTTPSTAGHHIYPNSAGLKPVQGPPSRVGSNNSISSAQSGGPNPPPAFHKLAFQTGSATKKSQHSQAATKVQQQVVQKQVQEKEKAKEKEKEKEREIPAMTITIRTVDEENNFINKSQNYDELIRLHSKTTSETTTAKDTSNLEVDMKEGHKLQIETGSPGFMKGPDGQMIPKVHSLSRLVNQLDLDTNGVHNGHNRRGSDELIESPSGKLLQEMMTTENMTTNEVIQALLASNDPDQLRGRLNPGTNQRYYSESRSPGFITKLEPVLMLTQKESESFVLNLEIVHGICSHSGESSYFIGSAEALLRKHNVWRLAVPINVMLIVQRICLSSAALTQIDLEKSRLNESNQKKITTTSMALKSNQPVYRKYLGVFLKDKIDISALDDLEFVEYLQHLAAQESTGHFSLVAKEVFFRCVLDFIEALTGRVIKEEHEELLNKTLTASNNKEPKKALISQLEKLKHVIILCDYLLDGLMYFSKSSELMRGEPVPVLKEALNMAKNARSVIESMDVGDSLNNVIGKKKRMCERIKNNAI